MQDIPADPVLMTPEAEAHLARLKEIICSEVDAKYRRGFAKYGGNLTTMSDEQLWRELRDEDADRMIYGAEIQRRQLDLAAKAEELRVLEMRDED